MIFVTVCMLVGMVLGQRFKVLILAPTSVVALIIAVSIGITNGDSGVLTAMTSAAAISSLQIGYLIGISLRHVRMLVARADRRQTVRFDRTDPLPIPLRRTAA